MASPHDDIFYLNTESEQWTLLNNHFISYEFEDSKKVIEAYKNIYTFATLGNAILSKHKPESNIFS